MVKLARVSRSYEKGCIPELGKSNLTQSTFINDGIKAWNKASTCIKQCKSFYSANKEISKLVNLINFGSKRKASRPPTEGIRRNGEVDI